MSAVAPTERGRAGSPVVKLAYLCGQYPAVSHTFVLREVEALRRLGIEIDTFSIRRASAEHLLAGADHEAHQSTFAILPPSWGKLLLTHLKLAGTSPRAYLKTLKLALSLAPPGWRGRLWQLFYFVEAGVLWSECRRRAVHHIHVHLANVAADVALLACALGSAVEGAGSWSWSFTMHGPTELFDVSRFRLAEKLRFARFVVCISDYTRSQLMALCDPTMWGKLHVVHCGIPLAQFTRAQDEEPSGDPTIVCLGRLVPEKGQGVLLQSVAMLAERGLTVNVTLAGEGPARAMLELLALELGLASRTSFPGAIGQDDIHALYASASIFCLPSFAEGVPGVLMEAMAMELPVVSTRITGVPELVQDGHTGLLVAPGRVDELADALERLLTDPSLRRELGARGRELVIEQFNTDRSAEQLAELFTRVLHTGAGELESGRAAPNGVLEAAL
ncbi:MAG TPA: glycosyltransferase family 4 protein [Solirubrobacteraceae bacterium]|nr:glycosyltransferase family 4 protein [Solirubrobacteraceae bacterium]